MRWCGAGARWNASSAAAAAAKHAASAPAAAGLPSVLGAENGVRLLLVVGMVVGE